MAALEASPRLPRPLEEVVTMAAAAPELSKGTGPPAARAVGPVLHDAEVPSPTRCISTEIQKLFMTY